MTTYARNTEHNGIEITFDNKPSEEIRNTLKSNGYRWHRAKKLWYAKETEKTLEIAEKLASGADVQDVQDFSDWSGEMSDGYMGAIAWNGSKSDKHLYGSDLSKAIRQDLKEHGIKGCTVSCSTYSMGQSLKVKVKCIDSDFIPFNEWKANKSIWDFRDRCGDIYKSITDSGRCINFEEMYIDDFYKLDEEEQGEVFETNAKYCYNRYKEAPINTHNLDSYDVFTKSFMKKLELVNACINSYRYDDSNGMVDYFDTNFYYDIELNYKAEA